MSRFKGIVYLTQAQYEALTTKDADVLYCVSDKNVPIPTTSDSGKIVKVSSTGNYELGSAPASSVGFADITGQPSDNTNLSTALSGKLDKVNYTGTNLIYGVDSGGQKNFTFSVNVVNSSMVRRSATGTISTATPTSGEHATTKSYVDTADALKQDKTDNSLTTTAKTVVGAINENKDSIDNVRAVAEGKCKAYVISIDDNPDFDSQDASITKTSFVTIDSETVLTSALKKGDIVYVVETDVPDRWYAGSNAFKVLETTKVDLTSYQTKQDNSLATTSKQVVGAINEVNTNKLDESAVKAIILASHPVGSLVFYDTNIGTTAVANAMGGGTWELWYSGYMGGTSITHLGTFQLEDAQGGGSNGALYINGGSGDVQRLNNAPSTQIQQYRSGLDIAGRQYVYIYKRTA